MSHYYKALLLKQSAPRLFGDFCQHWTPAPNLKDSVCVRFFLVFLNKGFRKQNKKLTHCLSSDWVRCPYTWQRPGWPSDGCMSRASVGLAACCRSPGPLTYQLAIQLWARYILVLEHVTESHIWPKKATKSGVFSGGVWRQQLVSACLFPLNSSCCLYGAQCAVKPGLLGCLHLTEGKAQMVFQVLWR